MNILIFINYYLPGYKSGGPLRSILNLVEQLGDTFNFLIVTRDRDLGDTSPYRTIKRDEWIDAGAYRIFYMSPEKNSIADIQNLLKTTPHDIVYLNSFFDFQFSIKPLLTLHFFTNLKSPVILAPRGEFSSGALSLKAKKKAAFIHLAKLLGLYKGVSFQASSIIEKADAVRALGVDPARVEIAIDLPEKGANNFYTAAALIPAQASSKALRLVFLSRISPKKNLDFALSVLQNVKEEVIFDIYGPKEDAAYWQQCQELIEKLPTNIIARYCSTVKPDEVKSIFAAYDLFFFPTLGENYGHVIAESLSVGTPVLLSDQTPWRNLADDNLGWDIPLDAPQLFAAKIAELAKAAPSERNAQRSTIRQHTLSRLADPQIVEQNRALFYSALARQA